MLVRDSDAETRETSPTVAEARDAFVESLRGKSPRTVATYRAGLARLEEFLDALGMEAASLKTTQLPEDVLEGFYAYLVRRFGRQARSTLGTYVSAARAFYRYLDRYGLAPPGRRYEQAREALRQTMARAPYKTPRVDRRLPQLVLYVKNMPMPEAATPSQRLELLRDKALVQTLFTTGMRREEVSRLDRRDVDDGWSRRAIITGKGERERLAFFDEETLRAIRDYLAARDDAFIPLFLRHDRGRGRPARGGVNYRLSPQSIWKVVKRYARLAGVEVTTHDFRHAKASTLLNRGAKLSEVQDLLGHASPETTKRIYAHYEVSHLQEAFDRYSATPEELAAEARGDPAPE